MPALPSLPPCDALAVSLELQYLHVRLSEAAYCEPRPWRREALFWGLSRLPPALHIAAWRFLTIAAVSSPGRELAPLEQGRRVDTAPPEFSTWEAAVSWASLREALEQAAMLAEGTVPFGTELDEPPRRPGHPGMLGPPDPKHAALCLRVGAEKLRKQPGRSHEVLALWHLLFGADWPSFCLAWACLCLAAVRVYEPHDDPQEALSGWLKKATREAVLHALDEAAVIAEVYPPFVIT